MTQTNHSLIAIGEIARRTGLSITAIRFYESKGLIKSLRNSGGQRRFRRTDIRRLSFIKICQNLGYSLTEIQGALQTLPDSRTPTKRDWERLSSKFAIDIEQRIEGLMQLKEKLTGCIGCGCLSLATCKLYNPEDRAASRGAGPRFLMGDAPDSTN
ncbi:MAG: redox-sensitive transcriptional activator SoxR [Granulosicoccus sp.]|nr:redox-sensitive transcriptional activator SoxR [Granulosicoccus sp.]